MPSLHSAFALFVVVFFWPWINHRWIKIAMLAYPISMAVALAYFAEHYIIDALVGWLLVGASFLLWNRIESRLAVRSAATASDHVERAGRSVRHHARRCYLGQRLTIDSRRGG